MTDSPDTIATFCEGERISRSLFYKLRREGRGPRLYYIGNKPYISPEARREWRQALEAEAGARRSEMA
jgi:hypothetical protein